LESALYASNLSKFKESTDIDGLFTQRMGSVDDAERNAIGKNLDKIAMQD